MHDRKRLFLLGAAVIALGTVLGTVLWLKLGPTRRVVLVDRAGDDGLKHYGSVPDFKLTERSGAEVNLSQLRGKIWIADFIYTTCTDTCPLQTAAMAKLQRQFTAQSTVQFVSVSVDPERDTPQVLSAYADKHEADRQRWYFLTGQRNQVIKLIRDGFHLGVAALPDSSEANGMIPHSPRFVLVDQQAQIRGYYDSREIEGLARLRNDIEILLKG
jgi:cytochrome oxidase Cu insertion factor (SCO1/SenC/PrrC family)